MIRLACTECDRDDHDMIDSIPADWDGVQEIQSYEAACMTYDRPEEAPPGFCVLDWYTHLGVCPDCQERGIR